MIQLKDEQWHPIEGYEGIYEVSDHGRIKSLSRSKASESWSFITNEKIMVPQLCGYPDGKYYTVGFNKKGEKTKRFIIHRLVAKYFVPNPDNKPVVNHKDGNRLNNHKDNLEWVTQLENLKHAVETGLTPEAVKNNPLISKPVLQMNDSCVILNRYSSLNEASRQTGFPTSNIYTAIKKKGICKGYRWAYYEIDDTTSYKRSQITEGVWKELRQQRQLGEDNSRFNDIMNLINTVLDNIDSKTLNQKA